MGTLIVFVAFAFLVIIVLVKTAVVVPQQTAVVVERLGKYAGTLNAGFHVLVPFVDAIRYRHTLKEQTIEIPAQICITRDNVQVHVDGVLYLQVLNPERASYGISSYLFAIMQLAQTTLRSEIGKIVLDKTFEERTNINTAVVSELDKATESWGIKVLRYEIKNITPPETILRAMQAQITAEREKRALIAKSEGQKQQEINIAEGEKQAAILKSEGAKAAVVNKAQGDATSIRLIAEATAAAVTAVAEALAKEGGQQAANLKVAEQYVNAFAYLARTNNTLIVPANMGDMATLITSAMTMLEKARPAPAAAKPA